MSEEFDLFMGDDNGEGRTIATVSISLDLATAIAGYIAFQHRRPVIVFEGSLIRRLVDPPDLDLLDDLSATRSKYGFGLRIRSVKAKGPFGPYTYSPWIEAASFDSGRSAMEAFRAKRLKRTEEFQVTWCGDPVLSVGSLLYDYGPRKTGQYNWETRLVMLVRSFGTSSQLNSRLIQALGGDPGLPKGKSMFVQGPRICPNSFHLLPDDLESNLFKPV